MHYSPSKTMRAWLTSAVIATQLVYVAGPVFAQEVPDAPAQEPAAEVQQVTADTSTTDTTTVVTEPSDTSVTTDTTVSSDAATSDASVTAPVDTTTEVAPAEEPITDTTVTSDSSTPAADATVTTDTTPTDTAETATPVTEPTPAPASPDASQGVPQLTTDKADYQPGETATIFGSFFQALQNVVVKVFGGTQADGTYTESIFNVVADSIGSFTQNYTLSLISRPLYTVVASDTSGNQLAQTTFTDPPTNIGYDKSGYDKGTASWGTGNQSGYSENDWVQYQYIITGITGTVPNFNVKYDEQVSGRVFIDALSNFRTCVDCAVAGGANSRLADGTPRPPSSDGSPGFGQWHRFTPLNINNTHTGGTCNTTDALNTPSAEHCFRIDPSNGGWAALPGNSDFPASFGSGTHTITIFYEAHMAATFVWSTGHEGSLGNDATIYGVHAPTAAVPSGVSFGTGIYSGWTTTAFNGAGGGGSNKHFNIDDQSAGPSGVITLPIPAVTLPTGSITITKVTSPTPAVGVTFPFTSDFGPFTLDTDPSVINPNSVSFGTLPAGTFNFTETQQVASGWGLTGISCVTNSGTAGSGFVTSTVTGLSTITLASGAVVTCTYTNTLQTGHIIVVKDAVPNDAQDFSFTNNFANGNPSPFLLDDDADGTLSNSRDSVVTAGTYSVSEAAVAGWNQTSATCSDGSPISAIVVSPGETVTCTFVNTKLTSSVTTELHQANESVVTVGGSVPLGTTMHDKATVSANTGTPTGTVAFTFYTSNDCTTGGITSGTVSLSGVVAHPSTSQGPLAAGSYSFKAHYNGDGNYPAADSSCENFTVNMANLNVSTQIHDASHNPVGGAVHVALGSVVHDTASVTGQVGSFTPTGALTFQFFPSINCTGTPTSPATSAEATFYGRSAASAALASGVYSYNASVAADSNYNAAGPATCEPLTVDQAQLAITTNVHNAADADITNGSVALGSITHDTATVTGGVGGFTVPTPTFTLTSAYTGTCAAGAAVANNGTEGSAAKSADSAALGAGAYAYRGAVAGDSNYLGATSVCEPFTVNKAQLGISTDIHNAAHAIVISAPLGSVVHDTATVTGSVGGFTPTGAVTFTFGAQCPGSPIATDGSLDSGLPRSVDTSALGPGSYNFQGSIAGDANYFGATSACEPLTIGQGTSTVATTMHQAPHVVVAEAGSVPVGTVMHDLATVAVSPAFAAPTGNVDFRFYVSPAVCTNDSGFTGGTTKGSIALDGATPGVAHPSTDTGALTPGTYAFKAQWGGDTNYTGNTSGCETFTVEQGTSSVATELHKTADESVVTVGSSVPLGTVMHDKATVTVSDGFAPTGNVTFTFYNNNTCSGDGVSSSPVALDGANPGVAHPSQNSPTLTAGAHSFRANWPGDSNYAGNTSGCENFTVDKANTTTTTAIHLGSDHTTDIQNTSIALGSSIHDRADVAGQVDSIIPSGTLTYKYYGSNDCTGGHADETVALGTESSSHGNLTAGDYSFLTSYSGDANYNSSTAACETVHVNKAQLAIGTTVHSDSPDAALVGNLALGDGAHDSAAVTGKVDSITLPSVTFYFFGKDVTCSNGDTTGGTALNTLAPDGSGVAHPSTSETNLAAGTYNFMAVVAGNANYLGATSNCEPFTVNKADSSTVTVIHDAAHNVVTSVALGTTVHDKATVTGTAFGTPTGTVDFTFYPNSTCTEQGSAAGTGIALVAGVAHPSSSEGPLAAGSYSFKAHYNGDSNYNPSTGACEPLTVKKSDTETATQVHDVNHTDQTGQSVPLGSVMHDNSTVGTQVDSIAITGTVTYHFYADGVCEGQPSDEAVAVGSESSATSALAAGSYSYKADYSGDANYNGSTGACEPFSVSKANLELATEIHNSAGDTVVTGPVDLGTTVHDQGMLTGMVAGFDPSANVAFTFYPNNVCEPQGSSAGSAAVVAGVAHPSNDEGPLGAGGYSFSASYPGDANYNDATSPCEPLIVIKADSSTVTEIHDAGEAVVTTVDLNTTVHDQATVTGTSFGTPTGNVDFTFYPNNVCEGNGTAAGTGVALAAGVAHPSFSEGPLGAGSYSFKAHYNGDANYNPSTGDCEPLTVKKADTTTTTQVHDPQHNDVTNGSVALGTAIHDSATVATQVGSFTITGSVTYHFYSGLTCQGQPTDQTVAVGSESTPQTLGAGDYSYLADYSGDANYNASIGICEPVTVSKAQLTVDTIVHNALHQDKTGGNVPLASIMHDTATLGGVVVGFAAPTPTFTLTSNYNGETCSQGAAVGNDGTEGLADKSADSAALAAGAYAYRGSVAGNENYIGSNSSCEPFTVDKANPESSTDTRIEGGISQQTIEAGGSIYDTVTITGNGSFTPTGSVTLDFFTNGTCSQPSSATSGSYTLDGTGFADASTFTQGPLAAGLYSFKAHYSGDSNYDPADAGCELVTVVDASIVLSPLTATNNVNQPHTITATVTQDPGTGSVPAVGVLVTFSLLNNTAGAAFVGGNTCTTNASGQCSVQINSATPGSVDIHAATTFSVGGVSLTRASGDGLSGDSANANKVYVAGKITIVKDAQPNDLIDFPFSGGLGAFSLDDDQGVFGENNVLSNTKASGFIAPGNYTVTETEPNSFWTFGGVTCVNTGDQTPYTNITNVANGVTINLVAGADVTCTFVNIKLSPTRTLGFWQTHTAYTSSTFATYFPVGMQIGSGIHRGVITNTQSAGASQLFGGWYSAIPKTTTGSQRNATDKARMQLLQQLLAAKLNCAAFGCSAAIQAQIANADSVFATGTAAQILAAASQMDAFNNSGDSGAIPPVLGATGKATPKTSQSYANLVFWNLP